MGSSSNSNGARGRFSGVKPAATQQAARNDSANTAAKINARIAAQNAQFLRQMTAAQQSLQATALKALPKPPEPVAPPTRNLAHITAAGDAQRANAARKGIKSTIVAGATGASQASLVPGTGTTPILGV